MKDNMSTLKLILLFPLSIFEHNGFFGKFFGSFIVANIMIPFWVMFNKYVFNDWSFLGFVVVGLTLDIFVGLVKHYKAKTLDVDEFLGKLFYNKIMPIVGVLVVSHIAINGPSDGADNFAMEYLGYLKRTIVISYLSVSILVNMREATNGKFPPVWFIDKFKGKSEVKEEKEDENVAA